MNRSLFGDGETVLVAVSGGADSVALLDLLYRCRRPALFLVVAHLNHCLRGADSDADEAFVSDLARSYRLPFFGERVDVALLAAQERLSLEDAGRVARYRFLSRTAASCGAASVALAHHLDDQAETVLMRLLRGAGGTGLAAMRPVSADNLKRPLLGIRREELERYLKDRGLTWRTDKSNLDTAFLRNSVRHELIPFLRRYNPQVAERLAATAEILAADEELLRQLTEEAFSRLGEIGKSAVSLDCRLLACENRGLRMRLYRHAVAIVQGDLARVGVNHLESIDALVFSSAPNARIALPAGLTALRCYDRLEISASASPPVSPWRVVVPGTGRYRLPDGRLLVVEMTAPPNDLRAVSPTVAFLCGRRVPFPWVLRGFSPGDRIRPLGMNGESKVKDLFMDLKIPRPERSRIPLLFSGANLVWACGVRLAESARLPEVKDELLRVELLGE